MNVLTRDQLRNVAPSIFTRSAYRRLTPRYKVAATADVIDLLEGIGLFPVRAQQSRCRLADKRDYVKHLVRFRRSEDMDAGVASEIPEVLLCNSFDGSTGYRLDLGLMRVACLNGLVCQTSALGSINIKHSGDDFHARMIDATYKVIEHAPTVMNTVAEWKGTELSRDRQIEYAEAAHGFKPNASVKPVQLLTSRRREDDVNTDGSRSLWLTYQVCQEALLMGGIVARNARGRQIRTRPIRSVTADLAVNKSLWTLAQQFSLQ